MVKESKFAVTVNYCLQQFFFVLTSPVEAISHFNSGSASRSRGHENIGA